MTAASISVCLSGKTVWVTFAPHDCLPYFLVSELLFNLTFCARGFKNDHASVLSFSLCTLTFFPCPIGALPSTAQDWLFQEYISVNCEISRWNRPTGHSATAKIRLPCRPYGRLFLVQSLGIFRSSKNENVIFSLHLSPQKIPPLSTHPSLRDFNRR